MPLLPLDKVSPGMKTATPVVDAGGALLVREGAEITPELLERLRSRKITVIDVLPQGGPPPSAARRIAADPAVVEAELQHAFEKVAGQPVMKALLDAALARIRGGRKP
ncbi:MAG: hypothetical protein K8T20_09615 [Planctomycetes bacterium]|nr:hypothetical protein [Planctomycetota bacterium]